MNNAEVARRLSVYYFFQKASFGYLMVLFTAMFLNNYGAAGLPWYYVGQTIVFIAAQVGIMRFTSWQGTAVLTRLLPGLGLVAFLLAVRSPEIPAWTTFIALILARSGEVLANQSFFDVSGQLLPVRESKKRLPGIMAAGTVGSVLAGLTLRFFMAEGKLAWFLGIAAITFFMAGYLLPGPTEDKQSADKLPAEKPSSGKEFSRADNKLAGSEPSTRKYVWVVLAMSAGGTLTCSLVDFLFSGRLALEWSDSHKIATFLGLFNAMIELFSISVQGLFGGWLFRKLPLGILLTIRPFTLGILVLSAWWHPVFFIVAASQFVMRTSTFIFMAPSWVLLLEPLPVSVKIYARRLLSIFDAATTMVVGIGLLVWTYSGRGADPSLYLLDAVFLLAALFLTRILIYYYPLMIQDTLANSPSSERLEAVSGIRFLPEKERVSYLQNLLFSENNDVRARAIQECAREVNDDILDILIIALAREQHGPNITLIVKVVMSQCGNKAGPLLSELIHEGQEPRLLADLLEAIGRSDFTELEKTSARFLDFPQRRVRGASILNILRHGHDRQIIMRAIERLYQDMRDLDPATRATAAVVLGRVSLTAFLPALMVMVDDPVEMPAIKAINALANFRHPEVIDFLKSRSTLPGARGEAIANAINTPGDHERSLLMKLLHELPEDERRKIDFWIHAPGSNADIEIIGKLVHLKNTKQRELLLQRLADGDDWSISIIHKCLIEEKNQTTIDSQHLWNLLAQKSWLELPREASLITVLSRPEDPKGAEVLFNRLLEMAVQAWIISSAFPEKEKSAVAPNWCQSFENLIKILALWGGEPAKWHDTIEKARSADKFLNSVAQEFLEARVGKRFARVFLPLLDGQKGDDDLRNCLEDLGMQQVLSLTRDEARNKLGENVLEVSGGTMSKQIRQIILLLLVLSIWPAFGAQCETMNAMKINWEFVEKQDFVIGVLPYGSDDGILQDLAPLAKYLEFHLQRPVKINVAVDYHSLGKLLEFGKINLAWFSHALYENSPASSSWEIICRPKRENSLGHLGAILVKEASSYRNLQELAGKRIAYVDRLSGSGFIEPARMFRNLGIDPVASFSEVIFTGNHTKSIDALNADQVDAAAVYRDMPTEASAAILLPAGMRAIAWTDLIPGDPLVVRKDMNESLKVKLRDLFTNMEKKERSMDALKHLKARRGFVGFESTPSD